MIHPESKEPVAGPAVTNWNEDPTDSNTLEDSSGPSDNGPPNCLAHIVMLTEKINSLRQRANERHQARHNDPVHIT